MVSLKCNKLKLYYTNIRKNDSALNWRCDRHEREGFLAKIPMGTAGNNIPVIKNMLSKMLHNFKILN